MKLQHLENNQIDIASALMNPTNPKAGMPKILGSISVVQIKDDAINKAAIKIQMISLLIILSILAIGCSEPIRFKFTFT